MREGVCRCAAMSANRQGVILIMSKPNKVETWLKRQLGDGKEQLAEDVVIQGMMAGFGEAAHSPSRPSVADHTLLCSGESSTAQRIHGTVADSNKRTSIKQGFHRLVDFSGTMDAASERF